MNEQLRQAKDALDSIIKKSRTYWYKPIQIAEVLYHDRVVGDADLNNLESYRIASKHWRNEVTMALLNAKSSSSNDYQDGLFLKQMPQQYIKLLGKENRRTNGAVEAYIYGQFLHNQILLNKILHYCNAATTEDFDIEYLLDTFLKENGLRHSMDKVYEVIVYALFSTLVEKLGLQVEVSVDVDKLGILSEFLDFAKMIMGIDVNIRKSKQKAKIYRVGVANAADKGLDMYSNWGPAIQIKHLTLDVQKAESIVSEISSDRIVIVCQEAEASVILALLSQIGWKSRIQSIVTEKNLVDWYEKALRGKNSDILGSTLLKKMRDELVNEFPHVKEIPEIITSRNYDDTFYPEWTVMM